MKITEFLASIEGMSENTKRSYEQSLWQLHSRTDGDEPTEEEIMSFLKKYKPSSLHRHRAALKAYWEFTHPKNEPWPFDRRQFAAKKQRIPRYQTPQTVQDIINKTDDPDDKMFLRTLFNLGCRISELMSITEDRISDRGVRVVTKGGNEYLKVTTAGFAKELRQYAKGKPERIFPRTYTYYDRLLKRLAKEAGHPNITLHQIRHARAIDLLRKGMQLTDVQQFLGHASINTTAIYLQITGGDLAKQLEKAESNGVE